MKPAAALPERLPTAESKASARMRVAEAALVIIAIGVVITLLRWGQAFFVPLLLGIFTAYALRPLVAGLAKLRIPLHLGAALVICAVTALATFGLITLRDGALDLAADLPEAARTLRNMVTEPGRVPSPLAQIHKAANELEKAAAEATGAKAPARPFVGPEREGPIVSAVGTFLLATTTGVLSVVLELGVAALLGYFLLAGGDSFRRKVTRIAGPSLAKRRITVELLNEIDTQIQRSLLIMVITNVLIALAAWGWFAVMGMPRPAAWGIVIGLLHLIPYVGIALAAAAAAVAGLLEFNDVPRTLALASGVLVIAAAFGIAFQTWLQSNSSRMNAVVVFAGLMFFGWLWGAWGLILGVPALAVLKAIADRFERLRWLSELMAI